MNSKKSLITAFQFNINMNLEELRHYLSSRMNCEWQAKDSEYFGDYIRIRKDTNTVIRIFIQNDGYLADLLNTTPELKEWDAEIEEFQKILREKGAAQFILAENYY